MFGKIKSLVSAALCAIAVLIGSVVNAAPNNPALHYFFLKADESSTVTVGNQNADSTHSIECFNGQTIYANYHGGCVPPGGGFVGWLTVYNTTTGDRHTYLLYIDPGCESRSWAVGGDQQPVTLSQYCPCH